MVRVPGSSFTVFEAEGSLDGFRHGKLVLSSFASSFVQRVELAVNVAGAPGDFLTFRNSGANHQKARGCESAHGQGRMETRRQG